MVEGEESEESVREVKCYSVGQETQNLQQEIRNRSRCVRLRFIQCWLTEARARRCQLAQLSSNLTSDKHNNAEEKHNKLLNVSNQLNLRGL